MTTEPIRNKNDVRRLAEYYLNKGQFRNYALVVLGVHTALRIIGLLRLRWDDVSDFDNNRVRDSATIIEKKTRKFKTFALNREYSPCFDPACRAEALSRSVHLSNSLCLFWKNVSITCCNSDTVNRCKSFCVSFSRSS